jgi:transcriptional regulator with GAF, ATPase, and Fis domain
MAAIAIHVRGPRAVGAFESVRAALAPWFERIEPAQEQRELSQDVVLFDELDDLLGQTLRELSAGNRRVLALGVGLAELSAEQHWELLRAGAADVQHWEGPHSAALIAARLQRWDEIDRLLASKLVRENLCGESPAFKRVLRELIETAHWTGSSVLLLGESGTGKELAARLIHTLDARSAKTQLVVLDCTTIVSELSGSEFFGHERGAFTGAAAARDGAFALAHGGTLFLDEIGELALPLQAQLLRVIQERTYKRVGGSQWHDAQFRLICATHRDLESDVRAGRFRNDLYHRIAQSTFRLPALGERAQDVLPLARRFLAELLGPDARIDFQEPVRQYLVRRAYPGNVRELRQLMHRIASRHVGRGYISVGDIPEDDRPSETSALDWRSRELDAAIQRAVCHGVGLKELSQYATDAAIRIAVAEEGGSLQRAAQRLGVTDRALQLRRAQRGS